MAAPYQSLTSFPVYVLMSCTVVACHGLLAFSMRYNILAINGIYFDILSGSRCIATVLSTIAVQNIAATLDCGAIILNSRGLSGAKSTEYDIPE